MIPDKHFHAYHGPCWGWGTSLLAAIKGSAGYW